MDDVISRQKAIEAIDAVFPVDPMKSEYAQGIACGAALAKTYIEQLSSAQSEKSTTAEKSQLAEEKSTRKLIYLDDAIRIVESFYKVNADIRRIMAFELRQLPSAQPEKAQLSGEDATFDCVSRQAAIDILDAFEVKIENGEPFAYSWARMRITELHSAQPEIIRCKDCKHHWTHRCMDSMPTEICELDQTFYDANVDFCSLAERRTE